MTRGESLVGTSTVTLDVFVHFCVNFVGESETTRRRRGRTTVRMVNGENDDGSTMSLYDALGVKASATKTEVR